MWKTLNYGEKVTVGDTLRYRSNSNSLLPENETFVVARTDQHYFEIIQKTENTNGSGPPHRRVVRYMDIGYNVALERWSTP